MFSSAWFSVCDPHRPNVWDKGSIPWRQGKSLKLEHLRCQPWALGIIA